MRIETDLDFRDALYGLYLALHQAKQVCRKDFPDGRLTTIHTAIMGIENVGWRVIGITREALELLATEGFNKNKLPRRLCRGHIIDRIETTRILFDRDKPVAHDEYFTTFLENDCTVIMLNEQNKHGQPFPEYITIDNPHGELFSNGSLIGWKHRKTEREYLRALHSRLLG